MVTSRRLEREPDRLERPVAFEVEPEREPEPVDVVGRVELRRPLEWSRPRPASTVTVTGSPPLPRIASARSADSPSVVPFTAVISSPGCNPIAAAGKPGLTSTTRVAPVGTPSMKTTASARTAKT